MKFRIAERGFDYPAAPAQPCAVDDSSLSVAFDHEGPLFRAAVEQWLAAEAAIAPFAWYFLRRNLCGFAPRR